MQAQIKLWNQSQEKAFDIWQTLESCVTIAPRHNYGMGYGAKIPTRYMVRFNGRWRRVYAACYGNAATLYIGKPGQWLATVESIDGRPT